MAEGHVGWVPGRLRQWRLTYGLSLEAAGERLRQICREHNLTPPAANFQTLWQHERGVVYPGPHYRRVYCLLYGASEVDLGFRRPLPEESGGRAPAIGPPGEYGTVGGRPIPPSAGSVPATEYGADDRPGNRYRAVDAFTQPASLSTAWRMEPARAGPPNLPAPVAQSPPNMSDTAAVSGFSWNHAGAVLALRAAEEQEMLDRREFLALAPPVAAAMASEWLSAGPAKVAETGGGNRLAPDVVGTIEQGVPRIRTLEATSGGPRVLRLLVAELGMVTDLLSEARYTSGVGRRLHGVAAELGRLAGWAAFDAGKNSAAERYWVAALHAAHVAGDRALGADVLKSMSLQCDDLGRPREALALAAAARRGCGPVTARARSMFALREARAHAALGDQRLTYRLLRSAEAARSRWSTDRTGEPPWIGYFDEGEFSAQAGICHLYLREYGQAQQRFSTAVAALPNGKVRDRATYLTRWAETCLHLGDRERAGALLAQAVRQAQRAPSGRNARQIERLRRQLPARVRPARPDGVASVPT